MPNRRFQRFGVTLVQSQNKFGAESDTITEIIWCRKKLFWCRKKTKLVRKKIILVQKREKPAGPFWCLKETFWCWNRSPPPQHTHGGLVAPQNRSKLKMISKCLAANLIHINLRQSMCQNPNIYKMQICISGESSLQQVIIELNLV